MEISLKGVIKSRKRVEQKNANYHNKYKNFKQKSELDGKLFSIPYVL